MTTSQTRWIELRLKEGEKFSDQSVKINTFLSMNSHLPEQGYTLEMYLPASPIRDKTKAAYLRSDNKDFIEKCCGLLDAHFQIRKLPAAFVPPKGYLQSHGDNSKLIRAV